MSHTDSEICFEPELLIFPIVDVSDSMAGEKIAQLNDIMADFFSQLTEISHSVRDAYIKLAPMHFSTEASWFSLADGQPVDLDFFCKQRLLASGSTNFGAACKLLTEKLKTTDKGGWIQQHNSALPIIILFSGSKPTDNWQKQLVALKNERLFSESMRYAFTVGDNVDMHALVEFTGTPQTVVSIEKMHSVLEGMLRAVPCSSHSFDDMPASCENDPSFNEKVRHDIIQTLRQKLVSQLIPESEDLSSDNPAFHLIIDRIRIAVEEALFGENFLPWELSRIETACILRVERIREKLKNSLMSNGPSGGLDHKTDPLLLLDDLTSTIF